MLLLTGESTHFAVTTAALVIATVWKSNTPYPWTDITLTQQRANCQGKESTYVLLAGIDAPEIGSRKQQRGQPHGQEAKRYLEKLIFNKIVDIKGYGLGPYLLIISLGKFI
jgi:endonuclease YncB( thermonuclease family)